MTQTIPLLGQYFVNVVGYIIFIYCYYYIQGLTLWTPQTSRQNVSCPQRHVFIIRPSFDYFDQLSSLETWKASFKQRVGLTYNRNIKSKQVPTYYYLPNELKYLSIGLNGFALSDARVLTYAL